MSSLSRKALPILRRKVWRAPTRNATQRAEVVDLTLTPTTGIGPEATAEHTTWTWVSLLVGFPGVAFGIWNALQEEHMPPPEFVDYDHLRRRTKPFPWGDGNHSILHHKQYNALPKIGYEEEYNPEH